MKKKPKYKVIERPCAEFGAKCRVFVIQKLTWLGFYWDTIKYFFKEQDAEKYCRRLNDEEIPERIICSAIWYKELSLKKPEVLLIRGFAPYNVDKGIVFCGWRHPNCMYQMIAVYGLKNHEAGEKVQGFLTSKNRFVDRKEGAEIFVKNGGVLKYSNNQLYSEDLY